jgi:class 3 adenylate cyclase
VSEELASFLARHPWRPELRGDHRPLDVLWRFDLAASPETVWPLLIETSRLNRAVGVSPMHFEETDGVLHGSTRNLGFEQAWIEVPWDWTWQKSMVSVRKYTRGFAHLVRGIYELEPAGDGTILRVYFGWIPRGWLSRAILSVGMPWLERGYRRTLDAIVPKIAQGQEVSLSIAAPSLPEDRSRRLRDLEAQLRALELDQGALAKLVDHVEHGDEMDLHRIQVPKLARELALDEDALLEVCLHATRVGLLELSWDVICPHCRGVRSQVRHLGELPSKDKCEVCAIDFGTGDENAIEVTFRVSSSVREVPQRFYCSAEPATKPHIKLQQRLEPKESRRVELPLGAGEYRARVRGTDDRGLLVIGSGGSELSWSASETAPKLNAAPSPTLVLENPTDAPATFVIESTAWSHSALRPVRLFNLQRFRDLFSEEYLGADVQLAVGVQTILFTDVVGSTRFYREVGDPDAFVEVKKHFREIFDEVANNHGVVVKTIGDAVMAAFVDARDAVRACAGIQRRFPPGSTLRVRVSLNAGPCIAVNLNSGIDYFGSTVNMAAKLQQLAEAGEVALSASVHDAPGVAALLDAEADEPLETAVLEHAALDTPMKVYRWTVPIAAK